ncbi:MAG: hypothetical protein KDC87_20835, partial [Planctomycetes bacterium]|nr:hypothetical protein [Planctomycetota bacterium]
ILCILRSRQPLVGPNFYTSGASVRTALNTLTYPAGGGVHQQGQTWMGFCWDARTNLMATLGAATGEARCISIFIKSMPADATTQPNAVREVFIQDDDDGNLNNGTPNYADLEKAALKRKLPYPMKTGPGKAVYVPDADATTGGCNVIPFGTTKSSTTWVNQRYQTMVTKADLGNPTSNITICGLAFAPCGSGMKTFSSLQIILGQTTATSLGTNFASNRPSNARTVFFQRNYEWPLTANTWDPIGQEINYTYNPALGNLVVEVIAQGSDINASGFHTGARQRLYAYNWTTIPSTGTIGSSAALKMKLFVTEGGVATFGQGCVGSNSLTPTLTMAGTGAIGTSYTVSLSNALANAGAFLSVNVTGLWDPPLDLGIVGAAGCKMYFNNDFTLAVAANASGAYAIRLPIPTSTPLCERVYFQFFPRDARANRLGLTSTNYGRLLTGN